MTKTLKHLLTAIYLQATGATSKHENDFVFRSQSFGLKNAAQLNRSGHLLAVLCVGGDPFNAVAPQCVDASRATATSRRRVIACGALSSNRTCSITYHAGMAAGKA